MSIVDLIKETCEDLINLYKKQAEGPFQRINTSLIFPRYRKTDQPPSSENTEQKNPPPSLRISEQEVRFCFAAAVERGKDFCYSIETPTLETYSFTNGGGKISAQTDLTLWNLDGKTKEFNIEFKAHNPEQKSIEKDIEKLVRERVNGIWFHLFKNIDQGTFPALAGKFEEALLKHGQTREKDLLFAVCVLEKKIGLLGTLPAIATSQSSLDAFFNDGSALIKNPTPGTIGDWVVLVP